MGKSRDIEDPLESFVQLHQQKCISQRYTVEKLLSYQLINLIGEKKHFQGVLFMFHFWRGSFLHFLMCLTKTFSHNFRLRKILDYFLSIHIPTEEVWFGLIRQKYKKKELHQRHDWKFLCFLSGLTQGRHFVCFGYFECFGLCNKHLQYKNRSAAYF